MTLPLAEDVAKAVLTEVHAASTSPADLALVLDVYALLLQRVHESDPTLVSEQIRERVGQAAAELALAPQVDMS